MTSNKFTQGLLCLIAGLLFWLAIKPYVSTTAVRAAAAPVQYKVADFNDPKGFSADSVERQLNELGNDGWSLIYCMNGATLCVLKR